MVESDKRSFQGMIYTLFELYNKPRPQNDTLKVWWGKLERFEFQDVAHAFDDYSNNNTHLPNPAQIIELCKAKELTRQSLAPKLTRKITQEEKDRNSKRLRQIMEELGMRKRVL